MYDKIISIGGTCTPTWQKRMFNGDETPYPLDWITTPIPSLIRLINENFDGLGDPDSFEILADKSAVKNSRTNTLHFHDFPRDADHVILDSWQDELPLLERRIEITIDAWMEMMETTRSILFVRHQGHFDTENWRCYSDLSAEDVNLICSTIGNKYPNLAFDVLFVSAGVHANFHPRAKAGNTSWGEHDWENPNERWKGATREWQALLREAFSGEPTPAAGVP